MTDQIPSVGRIVHYVSYGTPGGEYASQCRAAIITDVRIPDFGTGVSSNVGLAVLNPSGMFFNDADQDQLPPADRIMPGERVQHRGGTWHWPEKV